MLAWGIYLTLLDHKEITAHAPSASIQKRINGFLILSRYGDR